MARSLSLDLVAELPEGSVFDREVRRLPLSMLAGTEAGTRILDRLPVDYVADRVKKTDVTAATAIANSTRRPDLLEIIHLTDRRKTVIAAVRANPAFPTALVDDTIRELIRRPAWTELGPIVHVHAHRLLPAIAGDPDLVRLMTYGVQHDHLVGMMFDREALGHTPVELAAILGTGEHAVELLTRAVEKATAGSAGLTRWLCKLGETWPFDDTIANKTSRLRLAISNQIAAGSSISTPDLLSRFPWDEMARALIRHRPRDLSISDVDPFLADTTESLLARSDIVRRNGRIDARMFEYLFSIENSLDLTRNCGWSAGKVNDRDIVTFLTGLDLDGASIKARQAAAGLHEAACVVLTDDLFVELVTSAAPEMFAGKSAKNTVQNRVANLPADTLATLLRGLRVPQATDLARLAAAAWLGEKAENSPTGVLLDILVDVAIAESNGRPEDSSAAAVFWTKVPFTTGHLERLVDAVENGRTAAPHALVSIIAHSQYWVWDSAAPAETGALLDRVLDVGRQVRSTAGKTYIETISEHGNVPAMLAVADGGELLTRHPDAALFLAARVPASSGRMFTPSMNAVIGLAPMTWSLVVHPSTWKAAGQYLVTELGDQPDTLATALGLVTEWDGTLADLASAARTL